MPEPERWTAPWPEPPSMPRPGARGMPMPPPSNSRPRQALPPPGMPPPRMPPPRMPPPNMPPPAAFRPTGPVGRMPVPPAGKPTPFVTNLEDNEPRAPRPIQLGGPPMSRQMAGGPPGPHDERYSWYPDIARDYEDESHYEPSVHEADEKRRSAEIASMNEKDQPPKPPLTKWERYKKHLRRRWYFYAVALILGLAVGLPLMFCVILPAIIQHMVDQAPFPLLGVSLTQPGTDSFMIGMKSALSIPGPFTVELDPTQLSLAQQGANGPDPDFATISLPSYQLHGNTTLSVPPQNVTIHDHAAFIGFISTAATSESYQITTSGKSTVHLGGLHANINIDKTLTVPGFNNFKGFNIPNAQLVLPPLPDGTNIIGNATLPNPTVVTIELGDFEMNIKCGSLTLGTALIQGLTLNPGNTTVPLTGKVDVQTILDNFEEVLTAQEAGLATGSLIFNSTMNSSTYHGVHLEDFEKAFADLVLTASLPITEVVGDSLKGFLDGNTTLATVTQQIMQHLNLNSSDLSSLLNPVEKGAESLMDELTSKKGGGSSLMDEIMNGLSAFEK